MYCPESGGCYFSDPPTIYSGPLALTHELVHAVASPLGDPAPMWSEGIAEALDIRRTFAGSVPPTENIHRPLDEVSYGSAGHFVRWAWDTYGPEVVRALLVDTREPEVAFEALTGQTLAEAEVDYYASAPYSYAPLAACEAPTLTKLDVNSWEESITLDCGDEWTRVGIGQLGSSRVFEVEARSDFGFVSDATSMVIIRCPDEDLVEKPEDDDPAWGDVPPLTSVWPEGYVRALETDGNQEVLDLVPGRYELAFSLEAAGEVMLEVVDLESP